MRYVINYLNITKEKRYHYVIVILNIELKSSIGSSHRPLCLLSQGWLSSSSELLKNPLCVIGHFLSAVHKSPPICFAFALIFTLLIINPCWLILLSMRGLMKIWRVFRMLKAMHSCIAARSKNPSGIYGTSLSDTSLRWR